VPQVRAFRDWIKQEVAALDWAPLRGKAMPATPQGLSTKP
jgi:hypothetical protein